MQRSISKYILAVLFIGGAGCGQGGPSTAANGAATDDGTGKPATPAAPSPKADDSRGSVAPAEGGSPEPARISDAQVLAILRTANQGEIDQANAALTCARNDKVIAFAKKMVADHGTAVARIDMLIAKFGSEDSPENESLMDVGKQQVKLIKEDSSSGGCDQVYVGVQIQAHSTVLALIEQLLLPSAQAPEVKGEVEMEKPVVAMHLDQARQLAREVGIDLDGGAAGGMRCDGAKLTEGQVVKWLLVSNQGEVDDGKMVVDKGIVPQARGFAQRMINDHGAAFTRLQALAAKLGITPQESMESKEKELSGKLDDQILDSLAPPAFDLAYMHIEVLDHYDDLMVIDDDLLPSTCTPELKAEVEAERTTVATHESLARTLEPAVRAAATK
jgi:putative membrane protein